MIFQYLEILIIIGNMIWKHELFEGENFELIGIRKERKIGVNYNHLRGDLHGHCEIYE